MKEIYKFYSVNPEKQIDGENTKRLKKSKFIKFLKNPLQTIKFAEGKRSSKLENDYAFSKFISTYLSSQIKICAALLEKLYTFINPFLLMLWN